jgi:WD40 repeat protein
MMPLSLRGEAPITALAFTPDGKQVVQGSQRGVELLSFPDLKQISSIKTQLEQVHDLVFSPDGKHLLIAGGSPAQSGSVELRTWPEAKLRHTILGPRDLIYRVAWSPQGDSFASASADGIVRLHSVESGRELLSYSGHSRAVLAVVVLPDGKQLLSAGVDQTIQLWDATSGKLVRTLDNHTQTVNDLAVRPGETDPKKLILASIGEDKTVRLWQPGIGRLVRFKRLDSIPRAVVWSPKGDRLAVSCNDGKSRLLDPDTLEILSEKPLAESRLHSLIAHPRELQFLVGGSKLYRVEP